MLVALQSHWSQCWALYHAEWLSPPNPTPPPPPPNTNTNQVFSMFFSPVQAPLTEEFVYRACMMPLLVQGFGCYFSVFICPLFFGVGKLLGAVCVHRSQCKRRLGSNVKSTFKRRGYALVSILCHTRAMGRSSQLWVNLKVNMVCF